MAISKDPKKRGKKETKRDKKKRDAGKKVKTAPKSSVKKTTKKAPKGRKKSTTKKEKPKTSKRALQLSVPTNNQSKLVDLRLMRPQNYLSETTPTITRIQKMTQINGRTYEITGDTQAVSTRMVFNLKIHQTNDLSESWSLILWDINQKDILPENVSITFVRAFERRDDEMTKKHIKARRRLAILSSNKEGNSKRQSKAVKHDLDLLKAVESGDAVMGFAAEAFITAPDEQTLEEAVASLSDYVAANDETRGIVCSMDINKQAQPLITYGPNKQSGNREIMYEMTSYDAALSALFVDSGGDRTPGSEYIGVSIGKLIRSHAAYNFQNYRSFFVGNDTLNKTFTIDREINEASHIYLSKAASRSYLLEGRSVTHIVCDHVSSVDALMTMPLNAERKVRIDTSKGLLNIVEPIKTPDMDEHPERIISRFPNHLNGIITLLSQFRDIEKLNVTDDFASITRDILSNFFVSNKYWHYGAESRLDDLRFFGYHEQYKTLKDFGTYIAQRRKSNTDRRLEGALGELDNIVNRTILPTIPALNTKTDDIVDRLMDLPYRIIDLTGMGAGTMASVDNPAMNVMMIAYLNVLIPSLNNGDVVFIHGMSRLAKIAPVIQEMLSSSGYNIDVVFTESNQNMAAKTLDLVDGDINFAMIDLYENRVEKLTQSLGIDASWASELRNTKSSFFVRTETGVDYIFLDHIL